MNKQIILKNSFLFALAVCALLLAGCADHYDGDETWSPQVKNATLTAFASR